MYRDFTKEELEQHLNSLWEELVLLEDEMMDIRSQIEDVEVSLEKGEHK